jgi:pimeloyl-ACP methyl ester carboxylesterase
MITRRSWMRGALAAVVALACCGSAGAGLADKLVYHPIRLDADWHAAQKVPGAEDCAFASADGTALSAAYLPCAGARGTILYLHGNAGNLSHWLTVLEHTRDRLRVNILALDYRGYGKSAGKPSESGLYADAVAAYDFLLREKGEKAERVLVWGHSLGTGVATELVTERRAAGLLLESPFTSIVEVAESAIPHAIVKRLLAEKFDSLGRAKQILLPTLVVHGTDDQTIPIRMGRALAGAIPGASIVEVPGAGHVDCTWKGGDALWEKIAGWADAALSAKPAPEAPASATGPVATGGRLY